MDENEQLEPAYEIDYLVNDPAFIEPFPVKKALGDGRPAWWNGEEGRAKVLRLIASYKLRLTVFQACISAGISFDQYKSFCKVHTTFTPLKAQLKEMLTIGVKQRIVGDLAHPNNFAARRWYLEQMEPETYGKGVGANVIPPQTPPPQMIAPEGKIIVSKQTAEALKRLNDNGNSGSGTKPEGKTG